MAALETPVSVKFWGGRAGRDEYDIALLKMALDVTKDDFGEYTLSVNEQRFGTLRARREISKGAIINIYPSPLRNQDVLEKEKIMVVRFPTMKGILGYRALIIRDEDKEKFDGVKSLADLQNLAIGQGQGWIDSDIYRANGVAVVDAPRYGFLYTMLSRNRFDAIALGVGEIDAALGSTEASFQRNFTIYKGLLIYYPFPTVYHVSAKLPHLVERLEIGLARLEASGEFERHFQAHHATRLQQYQENGAEVIILANPFLEDNLGLAKPLLLQ